MNILIASCGTRNKIIRYFKKALEGKGRVIATDASPYAPALYEADSYYVVPRITESEYIPGLIEICREEKVRGVLSLIDPELSLLSQHREEFKKEGVMVIGSSRELCDRTLDKWEMFKYLSDNGYKTPRTYLSFESFREDENRGDISYPVFVKPRRGSASLAISRVSNEETLKLMLANNPELIIQEYMEGQEIGADVYIDLISGECVSIFTRKKLVMRAGETDKGVSFKDPALFELIEAFVKKAGFKGEIDIDIFERNGEYYISEVNPRFGGGYPHAYECGTDHMGLIVNNLNGKANDPNIGRYEEGLVMMKYNEVLITREVN